MSTSFISSKKRHYAAESFKNAFSDRDRPIQGYLFIGKHTPYANDEIIEEISSSEVTDRVIWNDMICCKKIADNSLEMVIPRVTWTEDTVYKQYDDTVELNELLTGNSTVSPMYIINSDNQVFKCINNNNGANSTIEPTSQSFTANGNTLTTDSYVWKYMYEVPELNAFSTNTWIPAPSSTEKVQYAANNSTAVDGELVTVVVINPGSGYINDYITIDPFTSSCTRLTLSNPNNDVPKLSYKMGVSGDGILNTTYITAIDTFEGTLDISYPTQSSGGGANTLYVFTRTEIVGDGEDVVANTVVTDGAITDIKVTNYGKNYTYANAVIYGTGTGAQTRIILPPKYGHSYDPAKELGAYNVMLNINLGEIDSSEGGIISTSTKFRQYGILLNPCLYGTSTVVANANSVISQTTHITVDEGIPYEKNEYVYQGTISSPTFSGIVQEEDANNVVYLTNVKGTFVSPTVLKSANTNLSGRITRDIEYPAFEPYSGDILYVNNILPIERTNDQFENIKLIIKF